MSIIKLDEGTISDIKILITTQDPAALWERIKKVIKIKELNDDVYSDGFRKLRRIVLKKGHQGGYSSDRILILGLVHDGIDNEQLSECLGQLVTLLVSEYSKEWQQIQIKETSTWSPVDVQSVLH